MNAKTPMKNSSPSPPMHVSLAPGEVIDGRYEIESVLGEGTVAWVYLARHTLIPSLQCAVKVLKPAFVADDELREQFQREAETIARLSDPHTVRVSDFGELPDGRPYICMEYCIGATLDRVAERIGTFDDKLVAHIAKDVLYSLREAHRFDIVHRDIKPSNISLTEDPKRVEPLARVLDFGIAYVAQVQNAGHESWESELVFCTPSYASPEVLRGEPSPAADLYALGLTLAELLDGETVYPNTGFYTVAAQQMSPDPIPFGHRTKASALFPILHKACAKDLKKRYQSAAEMLEDVLAVLPTLPHTEQLSWEFIQPENCVGVRRCSLASDHLDIPLPAGCAMCAFNQENCRAKGQNAKPAPAASLAKESSALARPLRMFEDKSGFVAVLLDEGEFSEERTAARLQNRAQNAAAQNAAAQTAAVQNDAAERRAPVATPGRELPTFHASDFDDSFAAEPTRRISPPAVETAPAIAREKVHRLSQFTNRQRKLMRASDILIVVGVVVLAALVVHYGLPF